VRDDGLRNSHERPMAHQLCSFRPYGAEGFAAGPLPRIAFATANFIRGYFRTVPTGRNAELPRCGKWMNQTSHRNTFMRSTLG